MNSFPLRPGQPRDAWLQDIGLGVLVFVFGIVEAVRVAGYSRELLVSRGLVVLALSFGVTLYRQAPGTALLLVWGAAGVHVVTGTPIMIVEAAVAVVAFGCARWGSTPVVWLSGLSMPAGILVLLYFQNLSPYLPLASILDVSYLPLYRLARVSMGTLFVLGVLALAVPWLAGLLLRSREVTRQSQDEQAIAEQQRAHAQQERAVAEAARDQAGEIARLRAQQVQLANDVHDVVGHSLTVILAQAEAAQFLPADDRERIRETLENIANSARQSLGDVRQVLSSTAGAARPGATATLDSLIEGVRSAGNDVRSSVVGTPQPLPPELDAVAFRVLQEMLTNALKHGRRSEPLHVERHWQGELRIEVTNAVDDSPGRRPNLAKPLGVDGMRRRLESVGGRLDVRQRGLGSETTFTATAWVPLRPVAHA